MLWGPQQCMHCLTSCAVRCLPLQELDSMQRVELLHLQHFLEGAALPGKYVPLRDSTFKRKRELLGL
jgi:hypothetical protein